VSQSQLRLCVSLRCCQTRFYSQLPEPRMSQVPELGELFAFDDDFRAVQNGGL
jgi:hypothetical protein